MLKNLSGGRKHLLPFYLLIGMVLRRCNHFQSKNWRGYIWCCLNWSYKWFCGIKKRKHSLHFPAIFEATVLQSLAGYDYFHYIFDVFDGKLVIELITCEDNKTVSISKMEKEKVRIGTLFVSVWHQQLSLCTLRTYCTLISSQIMFC